MALGYMMDCDGNKFSEGDEVYVLVYGQWQGEWKVFHLDEMNDEVTVVKDDEMDFVCVSSEVRVKLMALRTATCSCSERLC